LDPQKQTSFNPYGLQKDGIHTAINQLAFDTSGLVQWDSALLIFLLDLIEKASQNNI
jgi:ABC-type transporter Mla MlaB component